MIDQDIKDDFKQKLNNELPGLTDFSKLFDRSYPLVSGVYNCLPESVYFDRIKRVEIETYSKRASSFDERRMLDLSVAHQQALSPLLELPSGSLILELGGGDGRFALYLMRHGYTVIESDIAVSSVSRVKEVAKQHSLSNGLYAVIDAENLPFINASLDAVFMVASLHHLPNSDLALKEISRVLKPNGQLLILREPASWQYFLFGPFFWLVRKLLRKRNQNEVSLADDETWGFSARRLRWLLNKNEFVDIKIVPVHYLGKTYDNLLLLWGKLRRRVYAPRISVRKVLKRFDGWISKVPLLRQFPWDWDVFARKR